VREREREREGEREEALDGIPEEAFVLPLLPHLHRFHAECPSHD